MHLFSLCVEMHPQQQKIKYTLETPTHASMSTLLKAVSVQVFFLLLDSEALPTGYLRAIVFRIVNVAIESNC